MKIMNVKIRTLSEMNIYERFDGLFSAMPRLRKEKILRLRQTDDKYRSLGAFALLMEELSDIGGNAQDFSYTENGKPYFATMPNFHFSLSHSGDYVMCVTSDRPCGCDIEKIDKINNKVIKRVLSPAELKTFEESNNKAVFYEFWTRKEALIKALDLGNTLPLDKIDTLAPEYDKILQTKATKDGYIYSIAEKPLANFEIL